jgi:hypothetical protein
MVTERAKALEEAREILVDAVLNTAASMVSTKKGSASRRFDAVPYAEALSKLQSGVDALDRAIANEGGPSSVYEKRGLAGS